MQCVSQFIFLFFCASEKKIAKSIMDLVGYFLDFFRNFSDLAKN